MRQTPAFGPVMRGYVRKATRVWRGGAYNNNARNARCAYRNRNNPNNRNDNLGFRVAVSTFSSPPEMRRVILRD